MGIRRTTVLEEILPPARVAASGAGTEALTPISYSLVTVREVDRAIKRHLQGIGVRLEQVDQNQVGLRVDLDRCYLQFEAERPRLEARARAS